MTVTKTPTLIKSDAKAEHATLSLPLVMEVTFSVNGVCEWKSSTAFACIGAVLLIFFSINY
jgi:hypothetical protein